MRNKVDLPAPFGPRSPKMIPRGTRKLMPSTARTDFLPRAPYTFTRFSTSSAKSLITATSCATRDAGSAENNSEAGKDRAGQIESPAACARPAGMHSGSEAAGALEESDFEKHSDHTVDCPFTVSGAGAEVNCHDAGAGRAGSARIPLGQ